MRYDMRYDNARMSASVALEKLLEGNERYVATGRISGDFSNEIRNKNLKSQHPYAVVVTCSDSRAVPEAIFDASLGQLFTIRVAGNVIGEHELGSIEYAVSHLGVSLVAVVGHTCCGAVDAAMHGHAEGHIASITDDIAKNIGGESDYLAACKLNAVAGAKRVRAALSLLDEGCVAMLYDIETGEVKLLSD